jgi:hypothetical protein
VYCDAFYVCLTQFHLSRMDPGPEPKAKLSSFFHDHAGGTDGSRRSVKSGENCNSRHLDQLPTRFEYDCLDHVIMKL